MLAICAIPDSSLTKFGKNTCRKEKKTDGHLLSLSLYLLVYHFQIIGHWLVLLDSVQYNWLFHTTGRV